MKRTFRLTALIMALLMLVNISALATTEGYPVSGVDMAFYNQILQSASQAAQQNQNTDTADEEAYHWGYLSNSASFNEEAAFGSSLGSVPAGSLVKVYLYDSANSVYKIEYNGQIGYILGTFLTQCNCTEASVTDPATHGNDCIYPKYFNELANSKTAEELYTMWSSFTGEEQTYILNYLETNIATKHTQLLELLTPPVVAPDKEAITEDGTKVTVKGDNIPADVTLKLAPVTDTTILSSILPGIDLQTAQYFALDVKLMQGDNSEWQPTDDQKITVTISANNVGTEGQYVALYHNHDGVTDSLGLHQITNGNLTFKIDGFSYVFGVNAHSASCKYDELSAMETAADRYAFLMTQKTPLYNYHSILWEYKLEHLDSGLLCNCNLNDFSPDVYAPGAAEHNEDCPWHESKLPQKENVSDTVEDTDITVSVNGTFPEGVKLNVREAEDEELASYISSIPSIFRRLQLEINLMDANNQIWQHNGSMQVTISTSTLGETGDTIALYRIHNGVVAFIGTTTVTDGSIIFNVDDFSYVMGVNVSDDCTDGADCGYAAFESKTIAEKEAAYTEMYEDRSTEGASFSMALNTFISHVQNCHPTANVCMCYDYTPATHAYGSYAHTGYQVMADKYPCPWAFNQIPVVDQAEILKDKTEEDRAPYLETLTDEQKAELEEVLKLDEAGLLKYALIAKYSQEAIDKWFEDIEPDPTVEMMQRALNASALTNVVFEGDKLYSVYTGVQLATYNAETGMITDIATGLQFHIDELTANSEEEQG